MLGLGTTLLVSIALAIGSAAIASAFTENAKILISVLAAVFVTFMIVITCALETLFTALVVIFFALLFLTLIIKHLTK